MRQAPPEVQAYFESLAPDRREALGALRSRIKHVWPECEEDFSFRLPTYRLGGKQAFALGSQKRHMVLHVIPYDLLAPFKNELRTLDHGSSCIRFRALTPQLMDLLDRIIRYAGNQIHLSHQAARPTGLKKPGIGP
ncbi:MAG: iron chaperone [Flavobacteriales bacterium]